MAAWTRAEEAGYDLISCFDHVSASPAGYAAWDAPTLLAAMAGVTSRMGLAVHVLNASLRPPLVLAGQLAVAQAASGGRIEEKGGLAKLGDLRPDLQALRLAADVHRLRSSSTST